MTEILRSRIWFWYKHQPKYRVMFDSHKDRFVVRDTQNSILVDEFMTMDDAVEFCYRLSKDLLHE
jgi:hypothetical protein